MKGPEPSIRIKVDPTNPGQFFACCGLLEIAYRLHGNACGWFDQTHFLLSCTGTLRDLLHAAHSAMFLEGNSPEDHDEVDEEDDDNAGEDDLVGSANPIHIVSPFKIRLDWWDDKAIKTWAGSMDVRKIALAMSQSINPDHPDPFNDCRIAYDPRPKSIDMGGRRKQPKMQKREPFYFDSRRSMNSNTIDVGFSTNKIKMKSLACPSAEFLSLIGLQRCRPRPSSLPRKFDYFTWGRPYDIALLSAIVSGILQGPTSQGYQFENWNRTGKIRAYRSACPFNKGGG